MRSFALALIVAVPFAGTKLLTKYDTERALRVEIETTITSATTSSSTEVDGTPVEGRGFGGGGYEMTYKEAHVDRVLAVDGGKPTKVRRKFASVAGEGSMEMRDQSRDIEMESPFEGVEIELEAGDADAVDVKVVEGGGPDDEKALEGQRLESFLDGLLPKDEVAVDDTWDLEKDAIARALRLDVQSKMYAPKSSGEEGGGEGQRGGGGGRNMMGNSTLTSAEWKGTAKLAKVGEEVDGIECAVIELELEASGERELPAMTGGRRERMLGAAAENVEEYEYKLEGKLWYATKEARPLKLEIDGKTRSERRTESTSERGTRKSRSVREGKVEYVVEVSVEKPKDGDTVEAKSGKGEKK